MIFDNLTPEEWKMPVFMLTRKITDEERRELDEKFAKRPPDYIAPDLEELHEQRVAYAAQFNHDVHLICEDIRRKAELRSKNEAKAV
jgi:hypothetical protein